MAATRKLKLSEDAFQYALNILTYIRVNSEPGSRRQQVAERGIHILAEGGHDGSVIAVISPDQRSI